MTWCEPDDLESGSAARLTNVGGMSRRPPATRAEALIGLVRPQQGLVRFDGLDCGSCLGNATTKLDGRQLDRIVLVPQLVDAAEQLRVLGANLLILLRMPFSKQPVEARDQINPCSLDGRRPSFHFTRYEGHFYARLEAVEGVVQFLHLELNVVLHVGDSTGKSKSRPFGRAGRLLADHVCGWATLARPAFIQA